MRKMTISVLIILLLFVGCDSKPEKAQEIQTISTPIKEAVNANSYTLTTTNGEKIIFEVSNGVLLSKQLNGKMVLLNFWATWCKPCIQEMPDFVELQEKYKDDFTIVAVLFEKEKDLTELSEFMKKHNVNFPVTIGEENFVLAKAYDDIQMVPESFLYSKDGFFVEKFVGKIDRTKLEEYIMQSDD